MFPDSPTSRFLSTASTGASVREVPGESIRVLIAGLQPPLQLDNNLFRRALNRRYIDPKLAEYSEDTSGLDPLPVLKSLLKEIGMETKAWAGIQSGGGPT